MNWKTTVAKLNAKHYAFPAGWDTRDAIADQLECSADRVDSLLAPGLKSGEIEKQQFPVWDARLGRKVLVFGYRQRSAGAPAQAAPKAESDIEARVRIIAKKHPDYSPSVIRQSLSKTMRQRIDAPGIARILQG